MIALLLSAALLAGAPEMVRWKMTVKEKLAMALNYAIFLGLGAWAIFGR